MTALKVLFRSFRRRRRLNKSEDFHFPNPVRCNMPQEAQRCFVLHSFPLKTVCTPISFTIEMSPLGEKTIDIIFNESIDYPLLPIIKILREIIKQKDYEGQLL